MHQLGGEVRPGETGGEFGRAFIDRFRRLHPVRRAVGEGERHQVWMSHGDKVTRFARLPHRRHQRRRALRVIADDARRYYGTQFHPEVVHTPDGAQADRQFRPQGLRPCRRLDDGRIPRDQDRRNPRTGRRWPGDLRAFGRGRQLRRRDPDPRSDRRPADLRLRRSRPDAAGTSASRSKACSATITTSRWSWSMPRRASWRGWRASPTRKEAQVHRRRIHRRVRGRGEEDRRRRFPRAGHALSRRDRKRQLHRRAFGDDQEPPQCRRPARTHEHEAGRAVARTVQG
jgi:hypothetical protein